MNAKQLIKFYEKAREAERDLKRALLDEVGVDARFLGARVFFEIADVSVEKPGIVTMRLHGCATRYYLRIGVETRGQYTVFVTEGVRLGREDDVRAGDDRECAVWVVEAPEK